MPLSPAIASLPLTPTRVAPPSQSLATPCAPTTKRSRSTPRLQPLADPTEPVLAASSEAPQSSDPQTRPGDIIGNPPPASPLGSTATPSPPANLTIPDDQDSKISLPPNARKKLQSWIRSRHLICEGNFYIFETVDFSAVDRFSECIATLGGTVISVEPVDKIWMGEHRQVMLYRVRASLHTPCHEIKQYWIKYGRFRTRFDGRE
jgi:phycoerythrin-associated linker protein